MTGRHEGEIKTWVPAYGYTARHEAPHVPGCPATAHVADPNGEAGGLLMCNWRVHDGSEHYDQADGIYWHLATDTAPALPELAGAVA